MDATFGEAFFTLIGIGILVSLLPIFIAFWRGHPNRWIIFIITVVFGATILGWLIALVWSLHGFHRGADKASRGGTSGLNLFADDVGLVTVVGQRSPSSHENHRIVPPSDVSVLPILDEKRLSLFEATQLLERLHRMRAEGYLSETEMTRIKTQIVCGSLENV
ncbi:MULTISPECIES: superinfection immunity protein [unclassified Aureimonas]|uniref:superinfection immunity protein n=1 Tax=unclassified Aureimonas TaxID=2615206 RepID=UPI0006F2AFB5|nr:MULTISPECIES: superinfection immunity protein [unclassified Aureimonas]KQT52402.1 hypothetical protein ASG62_14325 [Aureimonas sp. Leaf427]KQT74919.1 hypothetical protein ASG54_16165 [Aureimonas sp. Leaf460]